LASGSVETVWSGEADLPEGHRVTRPGPDGGGARREAFLVAGITAILLLPFTGKAFHMDDPLFLKTAQQIRSNPLDFYGFRVNWYGTEQPMWEVTRNPPLGSFFLALASGLGGWSELALHLAFLLPAVAAALGTLALARRFCAHPVVATLAAIATPAFLVSSTNVMCDVLLVALWVWAVELWIRGMEGRRPSLLVMSGVLIALAALTKYYGVALVPLLFVDGLARTRRPGWWAAALLIPIVALAGYQAWTRDLYGRGLLSDAAAYSSLIRFRSGPLLSVKIVAGLSFAGGCLASVAFFAPWLWRARTLALAGTAGVLLAVAARLGLPAKTLGVTGAGSLAQLTLFGLAGAGVVALAAADVWPRRDADSILLGLWVTGTLLFAVLFNWTVNARSLLPAAPAVGILIARRLERRPGPLRGRRFLPAAPLAAAIALSLAVAWADWRLANSARTAAADLAASGGGSGKLWFEGHWGFQHYMEARGAQALDWRSSRLAPGDRVAIPIDNANVVALPADAVVHRAIRDFPVLPFLATLNPHLRAGFYLDEWGSLPFAFGRVPPERYVLLEVVREVLPGELSP
jgi:4-amino-4-deoxy-L-arabinose transferase-like glycosyltransferase